MKLSAWCCLVLLLGATKAGATSFSHDETIWTKATWPRFKLKFPTDRVLSRGSFAAIEGFELSSNLGPFGLDAYQAQVPTSRLDAEEPLSNLALAPVSLMIGCKVCHTLAIVAWETAKQWVHAEGTAPTEDRLRRLLNHLCTAQLPPALLKDWVIEQQRVEKLDVAGISMDFGAGGAPVFILKQRTDQEISHYETQAVQYACSRLLAEDDTPKHTSLLTSLLDALGQYAGKLDVLRGASPRPPSPNMPGQATRPDGVTCKDFHIQCAEWAAQGECERNPRYMVGDEDQLKFRGHCRLACGVCAPLTPSGLPARDDQALLAAGAGLLLHVRQRACSAAPLCTNLASPDGAADDVVLPMVETQALPQIGLATAGSISAGTQAMDGLPGTRVSVVRKAGAALTGPLTAEAQPLGPGATEAELALQRDLGGLCLYLSTGWWFYEVCHLRHVRQFHLEAGQRVTAVHSLGDFDSAATAELRAAAAQQGQSAGLERGELVPGARTGAAIIQYAYTGGAGCEERSLPADGAKTRTVSRTSEVRLACSPLPGAHMVVREPRKCHYKITLYVPSLCRFESPDEKLLEETPADSS